MKRKRHNGFIEGVAYGAGAGLGASAVAGVGAMLYGRYKSKFFRELSEANPRQAIARRNIGFGSLLGHAANAGVAISSGLGIIDRYQRIDERKKRKMKKGSRRNPYEAQINLPGDIIDRLGNEHINEIFNTPEPVETLRMLAAQALVEDDYHGVSDYERLIAILTAAETLGVEGIKANPLGDPVSLRDHILRHAANGKSLGYPGNAAAVVIASKRPDMFTITPHSKRGMVWITVNKEYRNPSYTVHVEAPAVRESVEVKGALLTTGGALRQGKRKLRGAAKVHPKWSVERNPEYRFFVYRNQFETQPLVDGSVFAESAEIATALINSELSTMGLADTAQVIVKPVETVYFEDSTLLEENPSRKHNRKRLPMAVLINPETRLSWLSEIEDLPEGDIFQLYDAHGNKIGTYQRQSGNYVARLTEDGFTEVETLSDITGVFRSGGHAEIQREYATANPDESRLNRLLAQRDKIGSWLNQSQYASDKAIRQARLKFLRLDRHIDKERAKLYGRRNGLPEIAPSVKSKLNKVSRMFHGPRNPHHGKVTREYISDRVKARNFSRAGSIPGIKLETDATGRHAAPDHICDGCTILTNPKTSKLGISTGKRVQVMGNGVFAAGKRLKRNLDRMTDEELTAIGVTRESDGGYNLGKANTQWYTTIEKWSDIEDPDDVNYFHEWAEETQEFEDKPDAKLDANGMLYLHGGKHTVTEAGIEN